MQIKTILNRIEKFKSFVYGPAKMVEENGRLVLLIDILARANGQPICSKCGQPRPGYDRLKPRRFEYIPFWGIAVFLALQ